MPQRYLIAIILAILWMAPFAFRASGPREKAVTKDRSARVGMIVQGVAGAVMWSFPAFYIPNWRILSGIVFALAGISIAQRALRHLDKQWRLDAALNADHQLIRTGPYAVLRHPIYSAMFLLVLGMGLLLARWPALIAGAVLYVAGTEIRVRSEEKLLRARFGEEYDTWARRVWAYVPFIR